MTKVHPNVGVTDPPQREATVTASATATTLTVWRKSLLFNCNGFTVFDSKGNLVFRVDNYGGGSPGEIVLMDAAGKSLLTFRRKKLSLGGHWRVYDGEQATNPRFSVRRHVNILHSKSLAHASPCRTGSGGGCFDVEGSYSQRSCMVYDDRRRPVAEVRRKEPVGGVGFGADVFHLVVQPGLESAMAMAMVVLLEQMFGARGSLPLIKI